MDHILVCSHYSGALWDGFETVRKKGAIEAIRQRFDVSAIIGHEQRKRNIGMMSLRFHDSTGGKTIEIPISPDNEVDHSIFGDMALDSRKQPIVYAFRRVPMADKEASFHK